MTETFIPRSSNLAQIDYDSDARVLTVTFQDGAAYAYSGVPGEIFEGLQKAPSAGSFFYQNVRTRYPYAEV